MKLILFLYGLFYPVANNNFKNGIRSVEFNSQPLVIVNNNGTTSVHSAVCPHMKSDLGAGYLHTSGCILCRYHGFLYKNGRFCGFRRNPAKYGGKQVLTLMDIEKTKNLIFARPPVDNKELETIGPFIPPEASDPSFRLVYGYQDFDIPQQVVTENLLDNLHIHLIHSFGNPNSMAENMLYTDTGKYSGKTTFQYKPRPGSLSTWLSYKPQPTVFVENEFYLPSTTVTRVKTGKNNVKTVVTYALPVSDNKTRLFWQLYRNFYRWPIMDIVIELMMKITLQEDKSILNTLFLLPRQQQHEFGLQLKYDVTIDNYRKAIALYEDILKSVKAKM
jgi:phenylpropionate dioxygenase-like ring-hydroxylating dioxygenase large terminal subunit